jgi:Zn-dependent protease
MGSDLSWRPDDGFGPPRHADEPARPIHPRSGLRDLLRRVGAPIGGALLLVLGKLKLVLAVLAKAKFAGSALTMLVSVGAYALLWPWQFAVLFVLLLLVHEMGHVLMLRRLGVPASAPMFIPFLGAFVGLKRLPDNAWDEARTGLAGPVLGSVGAAVVLALGWLLGSDLLIAASYTGFLLNLFNLLPIVPLDGGRAASALHPAMWILGLVGLAALLVVSPNPILILILVVGGLEGVSRWRRRRSGDAEARRYYAVRPVQRVAIGSVYLGLAVALVLAMHVSHVQV